MTPTSLLANVLAPYVAWGVGGDGSLSIPFSMLATTFAAAVESPFYKAAGLQRSSFLYSMQANILSWFVGLLIAYGSLLMRLDVIFFVMFAMAIPFSISIEAGYLSAISKPRKLKWLPIIVGNLLSGLLLMAIVYFGLEYGDQLKRSDSELVSFLSRNRAFLHWTVGAGCLLLFLGCVVASFRRTVDGESKSWDTRSSK